jgi:hypothetical protein
VSRPPEAENDPLVTSAEEVLRMARERFDWPVEDREPPPPPAPKGRDPFVWSARKGRGAA